jgi:hypothetical protein
MELDPGDLPLTISGKQHDKQFYEYHQLKEILR